MIERKKDKAQHMVTLFVTKQCSDRPMTNREMRKWIREHFIGCDYGTVRISGVKRVKPLRPPVW